MPAARCHGGSVTDTPLRSLSRLRVTILGCGAAPGVPSLSRGWGACDPANSRNRRRRASVLVAPIGDGPGSPDPDGVLGDPILVDTSPDLREQLLSAGASRLGAVLFTHAHADHLHGLDDLREVNRAMGTTLDIHADDRTLSAIDDRFAYAVAQRAERPRWISRPLLVPHRVDGPFVAAGIPIVPFVQDHKVMPTLGFRFAGGFAYSTDVVRLDDAAFAVLEGIHTWVVGCLSRDPHPTHAHIETVLEWAARVRPERVILTHMGSGMDYETLRRTLPEGVEPAYDGMVFDVPAGVVPGEPGGAPG